MSSGMILSMLETLFNIVSAHPIIMLALPSTRGVQSIFSNHCPLSSNQRCWLTSTTSLIFSSMKILVLLGIEPRAAWSRSKNANNCAMLPEPKMDKRQQRHTTWTPIYFKLLIRSIHKCGNDGCGSQSEIKCTVSKMKKKNVSAKKWGIIRTSELLGKFSFTSIVH